MKLKLVKDNDPILTKKASKIPDITPQIQLLAAQMLATMKVNKGIGLAAPQVGHSICMLVYEVGNEFGALINPEITSTSDELEMGVEGCLSFPKEYCEVPRYKAVEVKYIDLAGKTVVRSFTGLIARVVQHEIDHLNGITMKMREDEVQRNGI